MESNHWKHKVRWKQQKSGAGVQHTNRNNIIWQKDRQVYESEAEKKPLALDSYQKFCVLFIHKAHIEKDGGNPNERRNGIVIFLTFIIWHNAFGYRHKLYVAQHKNVSIAASSHAYTHRFGYLPHTHTHTHSHYMDKQPVCVCVCQERMKWKQSWNFTKFAYHFIIIYRCGVCIWNKH